MELFLAENISKQYANHLALDHVTVSVSQGSIYGLLGPNGAGKTTLIRIINQITAPDTGKLFLKGRKLQPSDISLIGYLPEERGLYKKMKVGEQAVYLAQLKDLPKKEAIRRLRIWFEKFDILQWWDKKVEELSKGMQQKVQFIITILHKPELLIFDEPFSGFDPINANLIKQEILKLKEEGATILFSTHNMASVEELCDHITLINKSKTLLQGEINEIKQKFKSNVFEIGFSGQVNMPLATLTPSYEIIDHKTGKNISSLKLKLNSDIKTNDLLSNLIQVGNIISFNEVIPNMNDVFIKVVEETNALN
ncbi:MAG: ABC transporter ATP-binding protein [Bacteroidetes bacterium GWF2_38_335]|nr:MAG: ABC transporter ATP-binding protein [Bacteroidetes bacterium GWF2_38_335]OFY77414.1 MAG: ABC transporter ATP-binding protein [Bacteroidetes bacterium RIFOXYA12_FULL_38_20]HBS87298.1 ABC transporter ATP-binding protein [Bacteroidales bacterium]